MSENTPTALVILDGLGISDEKKYNAFYQAKTPHLDDWEKQYFYTTLQAAGAFVGLPENYNGNSQVGHFTIGAGKIIKQTSSLLNIQLESNRLSTNRTVTKILKKFNSAKKIHLLGMASDGNIHSNLDHARAFIYTLAQHGFTNILVHTVLDGRDAAPQSALQYLATLQADLDQYKCGKIASVHGRYYAMDRNNNWSRTQKSFDILTQQQTTWMPYREYIQKCYDQNIFDEFIQPAACIENHYIQPGDGVIFFNFRPDRAIQLTKLLLSLDLSFFITPIIYHESLQTTPVIQAIYGQKTLLEILAAHDKKIFTIAETEKYAHVTYFFNGHRDINFASETRILIPSLTDIEPVDNPNMQAEKITETVLQDLKNSPKDFYLINYANADMVGHSGNLQATIKAIECLDTELGKLYQEIVIKQKGTMYITADHGNAEKMFDEKTNQACTSHTNNLVPFYILTKDQHKKQNLALKSLADIAPLILANIS